MTGTALLLIAIIVIIMLLLKCALVVPENSAFVVERLGRFSRILNPGFNTIIPFVEKVVCRRTLKPELLKLKPLKLKTADGRGLAVSAAATFKVADVKASCYNVDNYKFRASEALESALKDIAATFSAESLVLRKAQIEVNVQNLLDKITTAWGIETVNFEITNLEQFTF